MENGVQKIRGSIIPIIRITSQSSSGELELKGTLKLSNMIPVPASELTLYDVEHDLVPSMQVAFIISETDIFLLWLLCTCLSTDCISSSFVQTFPTKEGGVYDAIPINSRSKLCVPSCAWRTFAFPAAGYPAAPIPFTFISFHPPLFLCNCETCKFAEYSDNTFCEKPYSPWNQDHRRQESRCSTDFCFA
jgi:hypothetical protein